MSTTPSPVMEPKGLAHPRQDRIRARNGTPARFCYQTFEGGPRGRREAKPNARDPALDNRLSDERLVPSPVPPATTTIEQSGRCSG
jgi:hypothetical protein